MRAKESSLRRSEQEVDSLGFRNKQLEIRVASLQDDLNKDTKKSQKNAKAKTKTGIADDTHPNSNDTSLFSEDLQKKIFENAQLESLVADKSTELQLQTSRIDELESSLAKLSLEQSEHDGKLRKEIERLSAKNHDLEAKLVEASSIVGSDDTLYVSSECEQHQPLSHSSSEERLALLEKEMVYWRTQYEILRIGAKVQENAIVSRDGKKIEMDGDRDNSEKKTIIDCASENEQLIHSHYSKKLEELFMQKCMAESKLAIYIEEVRYTHIHIHICINIS